jgi:Integrase core domain
MRSSSPRFRAAASTSPAPRPRERRLGRQQARNLAWPLPERERPARFLIHERDRKFTAAFDEVFRSEGVDIRAPPIAAPKANAIAEHCVGMGRSECLDWLLISGRRHLERVLRMFVDHYNSHRPRRGLGLGAPDRGRPGLRLFSTPPEPAVRRPDEPPDPRVWSRGLSYARWARRR